MAPPEYPDNHRAILMSELWEHVRAAGAAGICWLTCDVALDPGDLEAIRDAATALPGIVHTGFVKLWPASTARDDWMWSHRTGTLGYPVATQDETAPVAYFSIDAVWTPAALLDLAFPAGKAWAWNEIDLRLSEIALTTGIPARVVPGCRPKHLHF